MVIVGSGKTGGNTDLLCDSFIEGMKGPENQIAKHHLGKENVQPCTGCNACRAGSKTCVQKDDFPSLVHDFLERDLIVLATPLYFWGISARLKAFIERLYCLGEKDEKGFYFKYPHKKIVLLATCADISSHFYTYELVDAYFNRLIRYMGWEDCGRYYATGCGGSFMPRRITDTRHLKGVYDMAVKLNNTES